LWLYERRNLAEAQKDLSARITRRQSVYPRLCGWVEENIAETITFCRLLPNDNRMTDTTFAQA
jgi:putative transposase